MRSSFRPLRERNFRLLAGARTISFFGTNLAPIAVAFAVLDLTGSAADVGIAFALRDCRAGRERHRNVHVPLDRCVWVVVTTLIVISVRDVREFRLEPIQEELAIAIS